MLVESPIVSEDTSTTSRPTVSFTDNIPIISSKSIGVIPQGAGVPTEGAYEGSKTSISTDIYKGVLIFSK